MTKYLLLKHYRAVRPIVAVLTPGTKPRAVLDIPTATFPGVYEAVAYVRRRDQGVHRIENPTVA